MNESRQSVLQRLLAGAVLAAGAIGLGYLLFAGWQAFTYCPNRDILSWDANLRFLTVLDMLRDASDGRILSVLAPIFDSPTWPALRPTLVFVFFGLWPGGADPVLDVAFTYFCFALLFVAMAVLARRASRSDLHAAVAWLVGAVALLMVTEVYAYALSAMLEIQGMLFAVWTAYFLFRLYDNGDGSVSRLTFYGLLITLQGLYHTKYPYGVMLLVGLVVVEGVWLLLRRDPDLWRLPARVLFRGAGGKLRIAGLVVFVSIALLALGGAGRLPEDLRPGKRAMQNLFFLATLIVFIDFNLALYRSRELMREKLPERTRVLYWTGLFPAVVWMLVHPDRFGATVSTQGHVQDAGRSFAVSLMNEVFVSPSVPILLLAGVVTFVVLYALVRRRAGAGAASDALVTLIALWALQLVVLEFITPNKQLRHVYHLLPAGIILCCAAAGRLPALFAPPAGKRSAGARSAVLATNAGVLILALGCAGFGFARLASDERLGDGRACFTGMDTAMVAPARQLAERLDPSRRYIELNLFHKLTQADGSWPDGRYIATDLDLLLRNRVRAGTGDLHQEPARKQDWRAADRLLLLTDDCKNANYEALAKSRADQMGVGLAMLEIHETDRAICMIEYEITR